MRENGEINWNPELASIHSIDCEICWDGLEDKSIQDLKQVLYADPLESFCVEEIY